ncbi:hypothetical protein [Pseudolactococcus yaeyamensis]
MYPIMRGNGWVPVITGERSVSFTFGETRFSRQGLADEGIRKTANGVIQSMKNLG